jgi:hypothetical protein
MSRASNRYPVMPDESFREYRCSRQPLSFAAALNCGIGSSSLNANVKAFDSPWYLALLSILSR